MSTVVYDVCPVANFYLVTPTGLRGELLVRRYLSTLRKKHVRPYLSAAGRVADSGDRVIGIVIGTKYGRYCYKGAA